MKAKMLSETSHSSQLARGTKLDHISLRGTKIFVLIAGLILII